MTLDNKTNAWEEEILIPTYPVGKPDKNPMFLEKRVYQGSSGVVYPHPVIDKIFDEKSPKKYKALFLENKYLKIMILPELGGRVQMALDKTNNYHFVYYNQVIKPALVGLAGPWISGGIEFNWPQHHRPSTFEPVDYATESNADGSSTVWVSEIEKMFRMKGMAGFTLYPDKAFLEIKGKLYNRTAQPQTFLWWANPAVHVDEHYYSVFPPDVQAVFDHGKRDVSTFPIATGTYYKVDYTPGTDISRYKNIPVPTSYMAAKSKYNFVGGYNEAKKAGLLHVADHHISPGKKQWTWGNGDFGQAWDRNLTDEDGPYFELMTGVFTDNQPDFSWIQPYEEKTFKQYFFPYKELGAVKNANIHVAVNLEVHNSNARIGVYATSPQKKLQILLVSGEKILFEEIHDLFPEKVFAATLKLYSDYDELKLSVYNHLGKELIAYSPEKTNEKPVPNPAKPALLPKDVSTTEQLYLTGLHLEQYRHATYNPTDYCLEALNRDSSDIRNNNAYGLWLFRKGKFAESITYFQKAVETLIQRNPNPYDGEPYYNLGIALKITGQLKKAYDAFYKATWNVAWKDAGYFAVSQLAAMDKDYELALEHVENALIRNYHNHKARHLKIALMRKLNAEEGNSSSSPEALQRFIEDSLAIDLFNFGVLFEQYLIQSANGDNPVAEQALSLFKTRTSGNAHNYVELSIDYASAGFYEEAIGVLTLAGVDASDPMVYYHLAYYYHIQGNVESSKSFFKKAEAVSPAYCFPNRLEDILVLQKATEINPSDSKAFYYLGNLWYDKRQYVEAISCWQKSATLMPTFPTVHRNLAIAYFNKESNPVQAVEELETAFNLNPQDSRVLYELDQLYKKMNKSPEERLQLLARHEETVNWRDDLYLEKALLYSLTGNNEKVQDLLSKRIFHPWEGGEGKVAGLYVHSLVEIAKNFLEQKLYAEAVKTLKKTERYPYNLGEGKLYGAQENDIHFFLGCAYKNMGDTENVTKYFSMASQGPDEPAAAIFYNDQPPEKIFYQGLALLKLGQQNEAFRKFHKLIEYGELHMNDQVTIDYFAVSLPDMLIFDDDLNLRNKVHCLFMKGLGLLGKGLVEESRALFEKVLKMNASHLGAFIHFNLTSKPELIL